MRLPHNINRFVEAIFAILLTKTFPKIYPKEGQAKQKPVRVGVRLKIFDAIKGPPIKKTPKIEKLKENVTVGSQKFNDFNKIG